MNWKPFTACFLLVMCLQAFGQSDDVYYNNLPQQSPLINVQLKHQRNSSLYGQWLGAIIKNNTNQNLLVKLEFYADLTCGNRATQSLGSTYGSGITLKPGQEIGREGYSTRVYTAINAMHSGDGCKPQKVFDSIIRGVGYRIVEVRKLGE